jgi:hypothetical protein
MFGNEVTDATSLEVLARRVEGLKLDQESVAAAAHAMFLASPGDYNPVREFNTMLNSPDQDVLGVIPSHYPISLIRRWIDEVLVWTVNITVADLDTKNTGTTIHNTTAGRSVSQSFAITAALIRLTPILQKTSVTGPLVA